MKTAGGQVASKQIDSRWAVLGLVLGLLLALSGCAPKITSIDPQRGAEGTEVTIEGKRFKETADKNEVKFGGVETKEVKVPQKNTLLAKVPAGAKTGPVSVTTNFGTGKSEQDFVVTPVHGEGTPPTIEVPLAEKRIVLEVKPEALPEGARAHFPAYDGDRFFVTLPVAIQEEVTAEEVRQKIIVPLLEAIGFERGIESLELPPSLGLQSRRADFKGLAQAVADEYASNPELLRPKTQKMIDVMTGEIPADKEIDMALKMGEGMDFAQFVAGIERLEYQFPFQQVEGDVPIEHTLLLASRWEGQSVTSVRGALFSNYTVVNSASIDPSEPAVYAAIKALGSIPGIEGVTSKWPEDGVHRVLLPYGSDSSGITRMHYAYRMMLRAVWRGQEGPFLLWLDAQTGRILKLDPLFGDAVSARGRVWNRDPGVGTKTMYFQVDDASGGEYTLQLSGVINRVDYLDDGYDANDVSISDSTNGSSATFANFDQPPINDPAEALCDSGTNKAFQQVNMFGHVYNYRQRYLSLGIFTPFPAVAWTPRVESSSAGCNAWSGLNFGACTGYYDAACPNYTDGTNGSANMMNTAHDATWIAHEVAHSSTPRFTNARPSDWCGSPPCSIPVGWGTLHDLCDAWSAHFESTNCWSGWFAKNVGGVDNSLYCANHDEDGYAPRLHEVTVPFNPASPGDHFPEHRGLATGPYADMQIGAAALWQVRLGMRSKCRPSGMPQYGVRLARALKETGFFGTAPGSSDTGIYRYLQDLEHEMVDQWATSGSPGGPPAFRHNGPHTTNKVTGGFARTGLFLIPYQCLDGDATTGDPTSCAVADGGENGGDAVVDIDDNDVADDLSINGVDHPEVDFLELGGPAPSFHVWTGPRYRLDGASGASSLTNPAPCNSKFRVEVSTDPAFPAASTVNSAWITVDVDPTTAASVECYGSWTPSAAEWTTLQSGGALSLLYYRARTRDAADGNERLSTMPGNGLWTVPPPYAVITADGQSDY